MLERTFRFSTFIVFSFGGTWNDVARAYLTKVEEVLATVQRESLKELVEDLNDPQMSREEKIEEVLLTVKDEVRYTGFEFGQKAIIPSNPSTVLKRGLGDCKDQSTLMVAMLRELGIQAHVALLMSGSSTDSFPEHPGLNFFNHAIVHVPGEKPLWIDPTAVNFDYKSIPEGNANRNALIVASETESLVRIPRTASASNARKIIRKTVLSDVVPILTEHQYDCSGMFAAYQRSGMAQGSMRQSRKALVKRLKDGNGGYESVELTKLDDPQNATREFEVGYKTRGGAQYGVNEGFLSTLITRELLEGSAPSGLFNEVRFYFPGNSDKPKKRTHPFVFPSFFQTSFEHEIVAPPGYEVSEVPDNQTIENWGVSVFIKL